MGSFATTSELRVVPANLTGIEMLLRRDGYRLVLYMESQYKRSDDLGVLRFHIHYLNNYLAALRVQRNLSCICSAPRSSTTARCGPRPRGAVSGQLRRLLRRAL